MTVYSLTADGGITWQLSLGLAGLPFAETKKTGDFVPGEVQVKYLGTNFSLEYPITKIDQIFIYVA